MKTHNIWYFNITWVHFSNVEFHGWCTAEIRLFAFALKWPQELSKKFPTVWWSHFNVQKHFEQLTVGNNRGHCNQLLKIICFPCKLKSSTTGFEGRLPICSSSRFYKTFWTLKWIEPKFQIQKFKNPSIQLTAFHLESKCPFFQTERTTENNTFNRML